MGRGAWLLVGMSLLGLDACSHRNEKREKTEPFVTQVGPSGGEIATPAGVRLKVPAGAVAEDTEVTIRLATETPAELAPVGDVYEFLPDGLSFSTPVTVTLPYDPAQLAGDVTKLSAWWTDPEVEDWVPVFGEVDTQHSTVTAQILHFSQGTVAELCPAPEHILHGSLLTSGPDAEQDLAAVAHCREIRGSLRIMRANVTHVSALAALEAVAGDVRLDGNSSLGNIDGLQNLRTVGKDLLIRSSPELRSLDKLQNLTTVGRDLWLEDLDVGTLAGLDSLFAVGGDLLFRRMHFADLTGLSSLASVGGKLWFDNVHGLNKLDGATALDTVGDDLVFHNNDSLSECEARRFADTIPHFAGDVHLSNNGADSCPDVPCDEPLDCPDNQDCVNHKCLPL